MSRLRVQYAPDDLGAGGTLLGNSSSETGNGTNNTGGQGNSQPAGNQSAGWRSIAPAEYRDNEFLKGFEKPADFFKTAIENSEKVSRAVIKPKEGATAEELAAYRTEIGLPESSDGYELDNKVGDTEIPADMLKGLKQSYFDADLSPNQAKAVHEKLVGLMSEGKEMFSYYDQQIASRIKADAETQKADSLTKLGQDWGDSMKQNVSKAKNLLSMVLTQEEINSMPMEMQNSAVLVKAFYNMSGFISDDSLLGGQQQKTAVTSRLFKNSPGMYEE